MSKLKKHRQTFSVILAALILSCVLVGCNGSGGMGNSNVVQIVQRVFPASRNINVQNLRQCSQNKNNYEAYVSYQLYDSLFNRYTNFAEWYLFWPPYSENSFFRGRCN